MLFTYNPDNPSNPDYSKFLIANSNYTLFLSDFSTLSLKFSDGHQEHLGDVTNQLPFLDGVIKASFGEGWTCFGPTESGWKVKKGDCNPPFSIIPEDPTKQSNGMAMVADPWMMVEAIINGGTTGVQVTTPSLGEAVWVYQGDPPSSLEIAQEIAQYYVEGKYFYQYPPTQ